MEEFTKKSLNSADNFVRFFGPYADNIRVGLYMKRFGVSMLFFMSSLVLLLLLGFFPSCKNDVNTMLNDYNGHYEPATNMELIKNPGDAGFRQEDMLEPTYYASDEGSINVAAPYKCTSYTWNFYKVIEQKRGSESVIKSTLEDITANLDFYEESGTNKREFRVYVPLSRSSDEEKLIPGTYILHLTVIGNDGKEYKDWCAVVIYKHVYGYTDFF